jgi:hypothetical protein
MLTMVLLLCVQEGALDLLDGETLYEDGWLFTAGYERIEKGEFLDGSDRVSDPLDRRELHQAAVLSAHWGLRHDLQLTAILPFVRRELQSEGSERLSSEGVGDLVLAAKYRFLRLDGPGWATNFSVLGGLELPTGSDDEADGGATLAPDLQPGSGSWDPFLGGGVTHEPGRWRFNAFVFYKRNGENSDDFKHGDRFYVELAAGNRFWLEPYPGPFMRADLLLRYRWEGHDEAGRTADPDSGGDQLTLGLNWAFRPRPTLDFQVGLELPVWESVEGTQVAETYSLFIALGVRI